MKLSLITRYLESLAPLSYQESYDNSGLLVGDPEQEVHAALVALDCTEAIVDEAIANNCNLIITHHPIVFKGLKKLNGKTYVERVIIKAIKNNIALYAIHTNLDSMAEGVNRVICDRLGIVKAKILSPKSGVLKKLVTFCPIAQANGVREALFNAGGGHIGNYSDCSFNAEGFGTFKGGADSTPFAGNPGSLHTEPEVRIELIFKAPDERKIMLALLENHPYEEVAYDIYLLDNKLPVVGAGMIGWLEQEMDSYEFLALVQRQMQASVIRHTEVLPRKIRKVAVCGGSGSFLLKDALAAGADAFVTADFKYHEFFDAEQKLMIADIGHFESEQFTSAFLVETLTSRFPEFRVQHTRVNTNPVSYFKG